MREMNRKNIQYALVSLLLALISNQAVYQGTRVIQMRFLTAWDITLDIDYQFPLVPWTLIIYLGSYVIWSVRSQGLPGSSSHSPIAAPIRAVGAWLPGRIPGE